MAKRTRLRLHVEVDLLGTRVTPSTRLRDPYRAAEPKIHILTEEQHTLWGKLFGRQPVTSIILPRISIDDLMESLRPKLPAQGTLRLIAEPLVYAIEVVVPQ